MSHSPSSIVFSSLSTFSSLIPFFKGVRVKLASSISEKLRCFSGLSQLADLCTFPIWILRPLSILNSTSQWLHLNIVSVIIGDITGSVADECEGDEITEAVDNDMDVAEDKGVAVLARAAWCWADMVPQCTSPVVPKSILIFNTQFSSVQGAYNFFLWVLCGHQSWSFIKNPTKIANER